MTDSPQRVDSGELVVKVSWGALRPGVTHASAPDLDLQALLFDNDGAVLDAVYWNKPRSNDAAVVHTSGDEAGDASAAVMVNGEEIVVKLKTIDPLVQCIGFTLSSFLTNMPLTDVLDVVVTVEHQPSSFASDASGTQSGMHRTCFLQDCLPAGRGAGLVACVAALKRVNKSEFVVLTDASALPGKDFVQSTPALRALLGLHGEGAPEFRIPISLAKGEAVHIVPENASTSLAPAQQQLVAAVRWDAAAAATAANQDSTGGNDDDVDLSAMVLDSNNTVIERVHWGQLQAFDGAIKHSGDDFTGSVGRMDLHDTERDNESIDIDLAKLPPRAHRIVFFVNNYESPSALRGVRNLQFRLYIRGSHGRSDEQTLVRIAGHDLAAESAGYAVALLVSDAAGGGWRAVCMADPVGGSSVLDARVSEGLAGAVTRCLEGATEPTNLRTAFASAPRRTRRAQTSSPQASTTPTTAVGQSPKAKRIPPWVFIAIGVAVIAFFTRDHKKQRHQTPRRRR